MTTAITDDPICAECGEAASTRQAKRRWDESVLCLTCIKSILERRKK